MENTIITYLIKVTLSLALFYGLYMVCLKSDTFLKIRRAYFLFAIFFSLIYPVISFELMAEEKTQIPAFWLSEIVVGSTSVEEAGVSLSIQSWLLFALSFVAILLLLKFIFQMCSVLRLRFMNQPEKSDGCCIIKLSDKTVSPFSFFHWVFLGLDSNKEEIAEIIAHERVHVKQLHSFDVLLAQLLCVFFWWNPITWLLKKEMKINLEYLADKGVLDEGFNTKGYQYTLLRVSHENTGISIVNNFNVSQLKKRITMMNKEKTSFLKSVKYLLAIPVGAALMLGNAVQAAPDILNLPTNGESTVIEKSNSDSDQAPQKKSTANDMPKVGDKKGDVYVTVDGMPRYPGGESAMYKYISENLAYPKDAQNEGVQGRVTVRFIVKSNGEITDVVLVRGLDPRLDAEAIRVVKAMPNWNPGTLKGKPVDVYFTLPIVYKLKKDNKSAAATSDSQKQTASL